MYKYYTIVNNLHLDLRKMQSVRKKEEFGKT